MASPESRPSKNKNIRNILTTAAAVGIIVACSTSVDSKEDSQISIEINARKTLSVANGEANIGRLSNEEFIIFDRLDGLDPKDSIQLARDFMIERGCNIASSNDALGVGEEKIAEFVKVSNPKDCLPELK